MLDLGANAGEFSSAAVEKLGGRCVAVEANPELVQKIPSGSIQIMHAAAWNRDEMLSLSITDHPEYSSVTSRPPSDLTRTVRVEGLTLESIMRRCSVTRVDLMKVDIEGAEIPLLLGSSDQVLSAIGQITVEFHESHGLISQADVAAVYKRLDELGFDRHRFSLRHHGDVLFVNRHYARNYSYARRSLAVIRSQFQLASSRLLAPSEGKEKSEPKVCLWTDSDVFAGTERHILDLAIALQEGGRKVTVACPGEGALAQKAREARIPVCPIEKRAWIDVPAILRLRGALRSRRYDLIHAHNGRTALMAVLAQGLARRGQVVLTQHFVEPSHATCAGWQGRLKHGLHVWLNRRAARVIAVSEAVATGLRQRREVLPRKLVKVWHGMADPLEQVAGDRSSPWPQLPPDTVALLCAARLEPEKGHRTLIRALELLRSDKPSWHCFIAGDGATRPMLQKYCKEVGLEAQVTFLGFRMDILNLMAKADLFVLPSPAEGFGLALLESMSLSKPVIAMASGGPLEIVVDNSTGLLVPTGDTESLAAAIRSLVDDEKRRLAFGRHGRERYLAHFTAKHMARRTWRVYEAALRGSAMNEEEEA